MFRSSGRGLLRDDHLILGPWCLEVIVFSPSRSSHLKADDVEVSIGLLRFLGRSITVVLPPLSRPIFLLRQQNCNTQSKYSMLSFLTFHEWAVLQEMAARRSFTRSLGKFLPQTVDKPVATMTAWRGELLDPSSGRPYPEDARRRLNIEANLKLTTNIRRRGLSFYPVIGAGQEEKDGEIHMNKEVSFVVQPVGKMTEGEFLGHIRELLYNPTGEEGRGPFPNSQWGAAVKVPGLPQAFLFHQTSDPPRSAADYTIGDFIGGSAGPRRGEPAYTQMKYGPRATPSMLDPLDDPEDLGNIKGLPGRRFTVRDEP